MWIYHRTVICIISANTFIQGVFRISSFNRRWFLFSNIFPEYPVGLEWSDYHPPLHPLSCSPRLSLLANVTEGMRTVISWDQLRCVLNCMVEKWWRKFERVGMLLIPIATTHPTWLEISTCASVFLHIVPWITVYTRTTGKGQSVGNEAHLNDAGSEDITRKTTSRLQIVIW
jgi:hypothetical protein